MKALIDDTSSSNGIAAWNLRKCRAGLSLDALDALSLASGFSYQAKWSRNREEYQMDDVAVCLDEPQGMAIWRSSRKWSSQPMRQTQPKRC